MGIQFNHFNFGKAVQFHITGESTVKVTGGFCSSQPVFTVEETARVWVRDCHTKDGEPVELQYSLACIYRLLFGAGENFETYNGTEILYFVPEEKRSAVDWYIASMILYDEAFPSK